MRAALVIALTACTAQPTHEAPRSIVEPAPIAEATGSHVTLEAMRRLPGTLWFVGDGVLTRMRGDIVTKLAAGVFPSQVALPDGRLVAVASRGDGSVDGERLVLVGDTIEPLGPPAIAVREPAVIDTSVVVGMKRGFDSQIVRIDPSGEATQLTHDPQGNFAPAALGGDIVFASSRDGDSELYRIDRDGAHVRRLTAFHKDDWGARPSPDGSTIAFLSDREGAPHVFLIDADGTNLRRLTTSEAEEDEPTWSPDGRSLAYTTAGVLHVASAGVDRVVARDVAQPVFSPDGAWIAAARGDHLWAIPLGGGEPLQITAGRGREHLPRWR